MRKVFFQTLEEAAQKDKNIFMLVADLGKTFFPAFHNLDPQRFINVGVAETNMIDVAAGLCMSGKNVYCSSIIPFLIARSFEQIRLDICYNNLDVKLLGSGGGLIYGLEGVTHHAIEDIALMRALPNMTVVAPGDSLEAKALAEASIYHQGPLYIRFGRDIDPVVHKEDIQFKIGKGIIINQGQDVCLMATGTMLHPATVVLSILSQKGFNPTLVSLHTIKPIDKELIQECGRSHRAIFTLEEHNIIGGLGSAVAEVLAESKYDGLFKRIGIPDQFSQVIGGPKYLLEKMGLVPESIAHSVLALLAKEKI